VLAPEHAERRDEVLAAGASAGYGLRPLWKPMHLLPMYASCPRDAMTTTESLWRRTINLPSSAALGAHLVPREGAR
jgi:perosamine synthetase